MMPMIEFKRQAGLSLRLVAALLVLSACEPPAQTSRPSPSPSASATAFSAQINPAHASLAQVRIQIQDESGQAIPGALVSLENPAQLTRTQTGNAQGQVLFTQLPLDTAYSVEASAPGYESVTRRANLVQLAGSTRGELFLAVVIKPLNTSLQGRVMADGQPVAGATVFDGSQSVSTGSDGRYRLNSAFDGEKRLTIAKTGYQPQAQTVSSPAGQQRDLGDITLSRRTEPLRLGLDTSHAAFGQSGAVGLSRFGGMRQTLAQAGYQVEVYESGRPGQLEALDVLMILSPSAPFTAAEISALQAFVQGGGKLIVSGEWAGFGGFDGAAANELLAPFKLQFGLDSLREQKLPALSVREFLPHPLMAGLAEIWLYQSASVRPTEPTLNTELLARTTPGSFRIASDIGAFAVLALTSHGAGKVIALGDSSLWSDEDTDANGTSNLAEADNRKLLQQLLSW